MQPHAEERPAAAPPGETAGPDEETEAESPESDPLGLNGACYVCHTTFLKEELSKSHLVEKVGCVKCHGLSDKHANDEDVGATKPDIMYRRDQVDASCRTCHEDHDVPARDVVARFLERQLPADVPAVCTDCHGTHKIETAAEEFQIVPASTATLETSPSLAS